MTITHLSNVNYEYLTSSNKKRMDKQTRASVTSFKGVDSAQQKKSNSGLYIAGALVVAATLGLVFRRQIGKLFRNGIGDVEKVKRTQQPLINSDKDITINNLKMKIKNLKTNLRHDYKQIFDLKKVNDKTNHTLKELAQGNLNNLYYSMSPKQVEEVIQNGGTAFSLQAKKLLAEKSSFIKTTLKSLEGDKDFQYLRKLRKKQVQLYKTSLDIDAKAMAEKRCLFIDSILNCKFEKNKEKEFIELFGMDTNSAVQKLKTDGYFPKQIKSLLSLSEFKNYGYRLTISDTLGVNGIHQHLEEIKSFEQTKHNLPKIKEILDKMLKDSAKEFKISNADGLKELKDLNKQLEKLQNIK